MIENIEKFYKRLAEDESVAKRLKDAQNAYPGSWEIRESFVEATMLPLAEELGLGFTIDELRKYETRLKVKTSLDTDDDSDKIPEPVLYQLLDNGWETASSVFEEAEESFRNK